MSVGFFGHRDRFWVLLSRWMVPAMMSIAYFLLVLTSDTGTAGKLWIALGLVFVLTLWWVFRVLMQHAALSRAVAVGDADRVLELAEEQLAGRRGDAARAPLLIYRALGHEIRGEWPAVLATLDEARPQAVRGAAGRRWRLLAASSRVASLIETGRTAEAREVLDRDLLPNAPAADHRTEAAAYLAAMLARGRVLAAEGAFDEALPLLQRVIDDVRSSDRARSLAHHAAARCAEARGETDSAARHRDRAARIAAGSRPASPG
jgi:tetratricopeptide (TPR) repeat protein